MVQICLLEDRGQVNFWAKCLSYTQNLCYNSGDFMAKQNEKIFFIKK